MRPHTTATIFSFLAFGCLVFTNLGATFNCPVLKDVYFTRVEVESANPKQYVVYGIYGDCYGITGGSTLGCSKPAIGYSFNPSPIFVALNLNATLATDDVTTQLNRGALTLLPAGVLVGIAFIIGGSIARSRSQLFYGIAATASIISLILTAVGFALVMYTYIKTLSRLEDDLLRVTPPYNISYTFGPAIFLSGAAVVLLFCSIVAFMRGCFKRDKYYENTDMWKDTY